MLTGLLLAACALVSRAQGTVDFYNTGSNRSPVYDLDGVTLLGSNFLAQLYYSADPGGPFEAAPGAAARFRDGIGAGYWDAGVDSTRCLPVVPGSVVYLQVRVWDGTAARNYEDAEALTGIKHGHSKTLIVQTGGDGEPPSWPGDLSSLEAFSIAGPDVVVPPTIRHHPTGGYYNGSGDLSFYTVAVGTGPLSYQWMLDGKPITGATDSTLSVPRPSPQMIGDYTVVVSNSAGSVTGRVAHITVDIPVITREPADTYVTIGGAARFEVQASCAGLVTYQWQFNGTDIPGATSPVLQLSNLTRSDIGQYTVTVTSSEGSIESRIARLDGGAPMILVQPYDQHLEAGAIEMKTIGGGAGPITYQWFKNGLAIDGATNSVLAFADASSSDVGSYSARVTNPFGSAITREGKVLPGIPPPEPAPVIAWTPEPYLPIYFNPSTIVLNGGFGAITLVTNLPTSLISINAGTLTLYSSTQASLTYGGGTFLFLSENGNSIHTLTTPAADLGAASLDLSARAHDTVSLLTPVRSLVPIPVLTNEIIIPRGFSFVANPSSTGGNTLGEILPSVPDGTILYKFDSASQDFTTVKFDSGKWSDATQKLQPGEGAMILNRSGAAFTAKLIGSAVEIDRIASRAAGFYLVGAGGSNQVPLKDRLNFEFKDGDTFYRFVEGEYKLTMFHAGVWGGEEPVLKSGESAFVKLVP